MSTEIKEWRKRLAGDPAGPLAVAAADAEIAELRARIHADAKLIAEQNQLAKERQEWALHTSKVIRDLRAALAATQAPSAPVAPQAAEDWLRQRYGAARGHHAWRDLAEAFNAGAALSVKAEPAAIPDGWQLVPKEPTFEWKVRLMTCGYKHSTIISDVLAAAPTPPTTGEA